MSQSATLEGLKQNPFRIFGLRVDLTSKELAEAIKDLSIQMEFGAELPHAFSLGAVDASALTQANQRLRDPVQRLCDECFWFWPMDMGQQDVALDFIANGDKAGAKAAWCEFLGHPEWGPVAAHNLAVLELYESFEDPTALERFGTGANDFLTSDVIVSRIKARLRSIDDPRLPRNSAPAILEELRHAMAANQIWTGLDSLRQGDTVRGHRHISCARIIAGSDELQGNIAEQAFESDLRRLEARNTLNIETATETEWRALAQDALRVVDSMRPFPSLAGRAQVVGNNTARTLRSISIHTYNEKKNRRKALEIAELAHKLAYGEILQKINDDISTVKEGIESEQAETVFAPINNRIMKLSRSTDCGIVANQARAILASLNSAVDAGHSKKIADVLYQKLGLAVRDRAIEANNIRNDPVAARTLINVAQEVAGESEKRGLRWIELRSKLNQDSAALDRNAAASGQSSGSCLVPLVAILCLSGAAAYAAPAAIQNFTHCIKTLLP